MGKAATFPRSGPPDGDPNEPFIFVLWDTIGAAGQVLQLGPVQNPDIPPRRLDRVHALEDVDFIGDACTSYAEHKREELVGKRQISVAQPVVAHQQPSEIGRAHV